MNILFRTDSSLEIGTGHVMRCLTLAKQLKKSGISSSFICRNFKGNMNSYIRKEGFHVFELKSTNRLSNLDFSIVDSNEVVSVIESNQLSFAMVIVDHYSLDKSWERAIQKIIKKVMVIDDLADRDHDCLLLLDQNISFSDSKRYDNLVNNDCKQLLGTNFLLLREEFLSIDIKPQKPFISKVMVFFGGSDPTNETLKTLNGLLLVKERNFLIDIVVGASNPSKELIKNICDQHDSMSFRAQINNMAEVMNEADLAFGAGGTATWERSMLGLPTITVAVAENQVRISEELAHFGATIYLGESANITEVDIQNAVIAISKDGNKLMSLSKKSQELVDINILKTYPVKKAIMGELY